MPSQQRDQDKPAKVSINLDTLEREGDPGPFVVAIGGKRYELIDAQELDFRELIDSQTAMMRGEVVKALEAVVDEKDRASFFGNRFPNWKLEKLFRAYTAHYGMPIGPDGPGERDASSQS